MMLTKCIMASTYIRLQEEFVYLAVMLAMVPHHIGGNARELLPLHWIERHAPFPTT
jgi:hypothetical protein